MIYSKKLLVFDWDGTLMDSQAHIIHCFNKAIEQLGIDSRTEAQISNIIGLGFREALSRLYPDEDAVFQENFVDCYRNYFLSGDIAPSEFFNGVIDMLDDLRQQDYFVAIATGKGRQGLNMTLKHHQVEHLFDASRCADETHSKPHPMMLHELMDYFGVETDDTLMIGDTEYDLQMATNARVHSLGVSYGVHEKQRLLACEPLACLDSSTELHDWLNQKIQYKH